MAELAMFALLLALFSWHVPCSTAFRVQSVAVRGKLYCGNKPAQNVLVKLFDEDDGPDPDDQLDSTYTKSDGSFFLSGDTMELTNIDPEIRIFHDCNMHIKLCKRKWLIKVPDKYISSGKSPTKTMDLGILNLEVELEDENRDCIH